jgi:diacylglycerol kinase family enzyme
MRTTLICNPQSGRGIDADGTAQALRGLGLDIVEIAHSPQEAQAEGVERIVVMGGDGTLAPAAELAAARGVPLAVVAGGTANDFVRSLGLSLDREAAIEAAARSSRRRKLELARMDERPFLNAASAGLSPAAARRAEPFKRALGPAAYPVGAVLAGLFERPIACRAVVDGREAFSGDAWQVTVASTGAFGGGAEIEEADPHDGLLDLVVVPGGGRLGLPRRGLQMRRGTLAEQEDVVHVRGDELVVEVPAGTPFNVDGEIVQPGGRVTFRARARAFTLIG